MSRFVVLLLSFFISTATSDLTTSTTATTTTANSQCRDGSGEVSYVMSDYGNTLTVTPQTYANCDGHTLNGDTYIRVNAPKDMNYYILFTNAHLSSWQKVYIIDDDQTIAVCEGDNSGAQFCPPVIFLKNSFTLQLPPGHDHDVQVVIVATSSIPYAYYAYSQLPAWATVATVIVTFIFVFLMTLLCCCCLRTLCCRRRRERTVSSGHARCGRNIPDGPPVYSANPVIFDLPPIYVVREEAPVSPKTPQFN